jgi:hypothetical protein
MKWQGIGALIDNSWDHYRAQFGDLLRITSWFLIFILLHIVAVSFYPIGAQELNRDLFTSEIFGVVLFLINILIIFPAISVWMVNALIRSIDNHENGKKTSMHKVSTEAWKLFLPQLWVRIIGGALYAVTAVLPIGILYIISNLLGGILPYGVSVALMFASLVMFAIPMALLVYMAFIYYEFLLGKKRGWNAIKQSILKVKGNFWPVALRLILPKSLYFIALYLIQFLILTAIGILVIALTPADNELLATRIDWILLPSTYVVLLMFFNPLLFITDYKIYKTLTK